MASLTHSAASANATHIPSAFSIYNNDFLNIIGSTPKLEVILENNDYPFAHEASVYIPTSESLFVSSNLYTDPVTNEKTIKVTKVSVNAHPVTSEIINTTIPMPNGGVNNDGGILWAAQGTMNETGGLFQMSAEAPYKSELVTGNFYGRQFNSINDVVVANDGSFWFTDPIYAYKQGIRPKPQLPNQVYRYDPSTKDVRVIADGFGRPNGISFSPDEKTAYISDTAETIGDGSKDLTQPATMYVMHEYPAAHWK
jgi:gluconolactonase